MNMLTLPLAMLLGLLALAGSLVFLAFRVSRVLSITVQAPTAEIPGDVKLLLEQVATKLTPTVTPASDGQLTTLIYEAVSRAEMSELKGADRFGIAKKYVNERAAAMNIAVDPADVAKRIEGAVGVMNREKREKKK